MYRLVIVLVFFFFFQAEDGIRDHCVTGVQTCALPIPQFDSGCHLHHSIWILGHLGYETLYMLLLEKGYYFYHAVSFYQNYQRCVTLSMIYYYY